jgi:hypothetical protein
MKRKAANALKNHSEVKNLEYLLDSGIFSSILLPFFTNKDLAALVLTEVELVAICGNEIISRNTWGFKQVMLWQPEKLQHVQRLCLNQPLQYLDALRMFPRLKHLRLECGACFKEYFPKNLQALHIGCDFNQQVLPEDLDTLTMAPCFNERIKLPTGVKNVVFGGGFNQPVTELPDGLQSLEFGTRFNKPLSPGILPVSLINLVFGRDFNQPVMEGVLPSGLLGLEFGANFNQIIGHNVLPAGLQNLVFGRTSIGLEHEDVLPKGLSSIRFGRRFRILPKHQPMTEVVLPEGVSINS